jgi:hypothetical protein
MTDFVRRCMTFDPRRRPAAQDLLGHRFLAKARGRDCVVDGVLGDLPPLAERFAKLDEDASRQTIDRRVDSFTPREDRMELPGLGPAGSQAGRFAIRREPSLVRAEKPPLPLIPEAREDQDMRITTLTKKVDDLSSESPKGSGRRAPRCREVLNKQWRIEEIGDFLCVGPAE